MRFWTNLLQIIEIGCALLVGAAILDLGIHSYIHLDSSWDNWAYHIPFAAIYGHMPVPFEMDDISKEMFEGFPALAEFLQGWLWQITDDLNATGVVNYAAFVAFCVYCHFVLEMPLWLVAMIALTTPLIVIHTATDYVDLCASALLAIGIASFFYLLLFPERPSRKVLIGGLAGIAGALWTKYTTVPIGLAAFTGIAVVGFTQMKALNIDRRRFELILATALAIAALPYIKNLVLFGNPFWPIHTPAFASLFPQSALYPDFRIAAVQNVPPQLVGRPSFWIYINSLLEIDHPTEYLTRPRWTVDQGWAYDKDASQIAFRSGGFWFVNVLFYLTATLGLLLHRGGKRSLAGAGILVALIVITGFFPQPNELRYYLYIPLTWAALWGMLYPELRLARPKLCSIFLIASAGLFGYMSYENWTYYDLEPQGYEEMARKAGGLSRWWDRMEQDKTYCAVDMEPISLLLTGPSLSEYKVVARRAPDLCPKDAVIIKGPAFLEPTFLPPRG